MITHGNNDLPLAVLADIEAARQQSRGENLEGRLAPRSRELGDTKIAHPSAVSSRSVLINNRERLQDTPLDSTQPPRNAVHRNQGANSIGVERQRSTFAPAGIAAAPPHQFRIERTVRCFDHIEEYGMDPVSQAQCTEYCLKRLGCAAFTQYDSGNNVLSGCFLFNDASKCRKTGASGWVSGIRGSCTYNLK